MKSWVEVPYTCPDFVVRTASRFRPKLHVAPKRLGRLEVSRAVGPWVAPWAAIVWNYHNLIAKSGPGSRKSRHTKIWSQKSGKWDSRLSRPNRVQIFLTRNLSATMQFGSMPGIALLTKSETGKPREPISIKREMIQPKGSCWSLIYWC